MALIALQKTPIFDRVTDHLWLGDIEAVNDLRNIDVIVNISNTRYTMDPTKVYYHFDIEDRRSENVSQFFERFIDIVNSAQRENKKVLVHCQNSVSRSPTLVLAYLLSQQMSLKQAQEYLRSKRSQYVRPNIGFCRQLLDYEKNVKGETSLSLEELYR